MGVLVAGDPDEADPRLRDERVRLVDHAQPGTQHRHEQRRVGQPGARGLDQWSAHRHGVGDEFTRGLVDQHQRQVAKRRAERSVVGALVTQGGQPRRGQRVVDNAHIHEFAP